jgi:hypothetical protein
MARHFLRERIMQSRDFCFWLQGFFEIGGKPGALSAEQTAMIRRHLDLVFAHEMPTLRERPAPPVPGPVVPPLPEPLPVPEPERLPDPPYPPPPPPRC